MNIKNYVKRLISVLICLALVATSVTIIDPKCYADEGTEVTTEETTGETSASDETPSSEEEATSNGEERSEAETKPVKKGKTNVEKLLAFANKQKGKPYRYGGFGPNSFDCIGFVYYVFANSGAKLKTSMTKKKANNLYKNYKKYAVSHNLKDAKAGDIIIYYNGSKTKHACIATGNGKCISARRKGGVSVGKLKAKSGHNAVVVRILK